MNEQDPAGTTPASPEDQTALFANLVLQQANMAMMLLGKIPQPGGGETPRDLDAARLFIDQLEMLEVKTKGNLSKEESGLLKQTLMSLRLAFVEAVDNPAPEGKGKAEAASHPSGPAQAEPAAASPSSASEDEQKKKFSKKY